MFVVADGMGGAQAGEVASEMTVKSFDDGLPDGSPGEALTAVIQGANRRIHDRSRTDEQAAGMGTTCTAAYVGESDVTIAHVGDSRAYLWRDGELTRLTRDHSLVGELVARGKLTEEQAEAHPQRSVITRALGPEADVQVDVEVFGARDGDVYLLCSDGLTSMIHEPGVKPVLQRMTSLEQTGRDLIAAANEAGGRDNITVILFRLEEVSAGGGGGDGAVRGRPPHRHGRHDGVRHLRGRGRARSPSGRLSPQRAHPCARRGGDACGRGRPCGTRRRRRRGLLPGQRHRGAVGDQAARGHPDRGRPAAHRPAPGRHAPRGRPCGRARRKKRRRRIPLAVVILLVLLVMVGSAFWTASRAVYFVGADEDRGNVVTIYRGLPIDLPFGAKLYSRYAGSGVTLESVPPARRATFTNHKLRSKDDAENLVIQLERGQLDS